MPHNETLQHEASPIPLYHLAQLAYNTPLVILPEKARIISDVLSRAIAVRAGIGGAGEGGRGAEDVQLFRPIENSNGSVEVFSPRASRFVGSTPIDAATGRPAPYRVTPEGVGIITIVGSLVNRGAWIGASSGMVSYEGIKHQCAMIGRDDAVRRVIIDMASPGGEAIGAFDCSAAIRRLAAIKPVVGFVNGMACSGGYSLLSGCTRIISIPEGCSGSIGVFVMCVDFSAALAMEGIKVKFIYAGDHKVEGNSYEELKPEVVARFQKQIDQTREMFVATVGEGRGKRFTADAARATQALVYSGAEAKAIGMIDDVGTFEDLMVELSQPDMMMMDMGGGDSPEDSKKQGASSPANTGALADAAATEDQMSKPTLWDQFVAAMKGVPVAAKDENGGAAVAGVEMTPTWSTLVHYSRGSATASTCVAFTDSDKVTTDLNMATCNDCLRTEITRAEYAAKAGGDGKLSATAIIETAADNFVTTHCQHTGKDATANLRAMFVAAKTSGDEDTAKRLESIAASFPKGQAARVDTSNGPKAADIAGFPKSALEVNNAVLEKLAAEGVTQTHPEFATKYAAARAALMQGTEAA